MVAAQKAQPRIKGADATNSTPPPHPTRPAPPTGTRSPTPSPIHASSARLCFAPPLPATFRHKTGFASAYFFLAAKTEFLGTTSLSTSSCFAWLVGSLASCSHTLESLRRKIVHRFCFFDSSRAAFLERAIKSGHRLTRLFLEPFLLYSAQERTRRRLGVSRRPPAHLGISHPPAAGAAGGG